MPIVRTATAADARYVAENLRQADRDELKAVGWDDPTAALEASIEASTMRVCILDNAGNPAVLGGCAPSPDADVGIPWMMSTEAIHDFPTEFLRISKRSVLKMHDQFPILTQMVDVRNHTSVGWMQWLGFQIRMVVPRYGVERRPFIHFVRHQHV